MRGKNAPQLFHDKPDPKKGANFMFYPQDLLRAINHLCTYNEQRLLLTLLGCKGDGSFSPSTEYILDMTGITKACHYFSVRKELEKRGYLKMTDGSIFVQTQVILDDYQKGERKKAKPKATSQPKKLDVQEDLDDDL